jgi:hypothetical protein
VLDRDDLPRTHEQRIQLDLSVLRVLRDLRQKLVMDIIVHTQAKKSALSFVSIVLREGRTLYKRRDGSGRVVTGQSRE